MIHLTVCGPKELEIEFDKLLGQDTPKTKAKVYRSRKVREMILLGVATLQSRDKDAVSKLYEMDDIVDTIYRNYLRNVFTSNSSEGMSPRCYASALLILRYLERISDHACYVGVNYIVTGASRPRR